MLPRTHSARAFDQWLGDINRICGPFSARPEAEHFQGRIRKLGGALNMSRVDIQQADLFRRKQEIHKTDQPEFFCVFQLSGKTQVEQLSNRTKLQAGDIVLIDSALPFRFSYKGLAGQISLILPRQTIERILSVSRIELGVRIPAESHIASLANRLISEVANRECLDEVESGAVLDSLTTLIKPSVLRDSRQLDSSERIVRDVREFINDNIDQTDLGASRVANGINVSVRSLYRAFSEKSTTLSAYTKRQRLNACARFITAQGRKANLTEVAYRFGFNSPSQFSRAFKTHFGITPTEFRKRVS